MIRVYLNGVDITSLTTLVTVEKNISFSLRIQKKLDGSAEKV